MTPTPRIQAIVNNFISELSQALAEESSIAISSALSTLGGGEGGVPTPMSTKKKPGPKPKAVAAKAGGRRSPEDVEAQGKVILSALKKKPGQSAEELAVVLGMSTKDLALPIQRLKENKALKVTGVRRGTRYSAK